MHAHVHRAVHDPLPSAFTDLLATLVRAPSVVGAEHTFFRVLQRELEERGSTEMGRIVAASNGLVDGTTLRVPTSGYHTMDEAAPLESVRAFLAVTAALADGRLAA